MHLEKLIYDQEYGKHRNNVHKTFDEFMTANMSQSFCPIQDPGLQQAADSIIRKLLNFDRYTPLLPNLPLPPEHLVIK
jgi:hypothetical protein